MWVMEIIFLHATRHKTLSWFDTKEQCEAERAKIAPYIGDLYRNEKKVATVQDKYGNADIAIQHVAAVLCWDATARDAELELQSTKNIDRLILERKRIKEAGVENIN